MIFREIAISITAIGALFLSGGDAVAQDDSDWRIGGKAYLWLSDTNVSTTQGQAIEADFEDVIGNLDLAFMGSIGARKGRWSWFGDIMYVAIDARDTTPVTGPGIPVGTDADVRFNQDVLVLTAGGGYTVSGSDKHRFELAAGVRYLDLDTDIAAAFGVGPGIELSDTGSVLDGFVAAKGYADLSDRWYLSFYGDVGAGDSDLTWQALVDLNYEFSKFDVGLGYRVLEWQSGGKGLIDDLRFSGPYLGLAFNFK